MWLFKSRRRNGERPSRSGRYPLLFALTLILALLPVAYSLTAHPSQTEAAWFDSNWQYRKRINIPSHSSLETNVYVTVPSFDATDTSRFQSDCGDLRFTKTNGQLLPYYVVDCDATATVHVLLDTLPAGESNYYMYYGNPSASDGFEDTDFSVAATGLGSQTLAGEQTTPGAVAYWNFDEGQGQTVQDATSNANNGTLGANSSVASDDPTWQTEDMCISGKCLKFDGGDVITTNFSSGIGPFTISAWVKGSTGYIYSQGSDDGTQYRHRLYIASNVLTFLYYDGSAKSVTTSWEPSTWHYVTAVKTASDMSLFIDGVLKNSATANTSSNVGTFHLGASGTSLNFLNGFMDEVKIYPYARSAAQIKVDYNDGAAKLGKQNQQKFLSDGLVIYYGMDEGTGTSTTDKSSNGNTGRFCDTLVSNCNVAGPSWSSGKFGNAPSFDGINDGILVTTGTSTTNLNHTNAAWIYLTATPSTNKYIFSASAGVGVLDVGSDLSLRYTSCGAACAWGTTSSPNAIPLNTWTHVAQTTEYISASEGRTRLYINGQMVKEQTYNPNNGTMYVYWGGIGMAYGDSNNYAYSWWQGKIDEARIYKRSLSPAEVRALYQWAPSPVAYWNFDEGSGGTAIDISGGGNNGTITGATYTNGKFGNALSFNGSSDYVRTGNIANCSLNQTLSAWVNTTSGSTGQTIAEIAACGSTFKLGIGASGLVFYPHNTTPTNAVTLTPNAWHLISGTTEPINGTDVRVELYVDGLLATTKTSSFTSPGAASTVTIGGTKNATPLNLFSGSIDEVKIYNYAQTPSQIIEDMNAGHPIGGSPVGSPLAYYAFDEQQGQTTNNSGNGGSTLNGTLGATSGSSTDDPTWKTKTDCKVNGCLSFDGTADYITIGDLSQSDFGTGDFSFSLWVYPTTFTSNRNLLKKGTYASSGYTLWLDANGKVSLNTFDSSSASLTTTNSGVVALNEWNHIAVSVQRTGTSAIYVNGRSQATTGSVRTGSLTSSGSAFLIGQNTSGMARFEGKMDEVKIYNIALTAEQVKIDFNAGASQNIGTTAVSEANLVSDGAGNPPVAYWNFDEKQDNTCAGGTNDVCDRSGNGNDGAWNGTLGSQWTKGKIGAAGNFNGTDNRIVVASDSRNLNFSSQLTAEAWIFATDVSTIHAVMGNYNAAILGSFWMTYQWCNPSCGGAFVYLHGATGDLNVGNNSTTNLTLNAWNHLVFTYDGSVGTLYLNGKRTTSASGAVGSINNTSEAFSLGARGGAAYFTKGAIDDVKLYNYARTSAQIAYDYNRGAPVGYWQFDECEGTVAYDASGNGYNGTITIGGSGTQTTVGTCDTSSTAWGSGASGKINTSLNFDGIDDYVPLSTSLNLNNPYTLSAWVKTTAGSGKTIMGNYNGGVRAGPYLMTTASGAIQFGDTGSLDGNTPINNGSWHHVAMTGSGTTVNIYIDGKVDKTGSVTLTANTTDNFLIGARYTSGSPSQFFSGQIDDVRVYNYALSADQVKQLYNGGSAIQFAPPQGAAP